MQAQRTILRSALVVNGFTLLGFVTGFFNQCLIAYYFGAGGKFDAFNMAQTIPLFICNVLSITFYVLVIPYLATIQHKRSADFPAYRASLIVMFGLIFSAFALLLLSCAYPLVHLIYFKANSDVRHRAYMFLLLLIPSLIFSGLSNILTAIHNTEHKFFLTSAASFSLSLVTLTALFFARILDIRALLVAANAGPLLQLLILLYPLVSELGLFQFSIVWEEFVFFKKEGSFLLISQVFGQSSQPIIRVFSSTLPLGNVSYFAYADKLFSAFNSFFGNTIETIGLPTFSDVAAHSREELHRLFIKALNLSIFIAAPLACLWFLLAGDIVGILYQHGRFTVADTKTVTLILRIYGLQVYLSVAFAALSQMLYALKRSTMAGKIWIGVGVGHIMFAYALTKFFHTEGLAVSYGIAWCLSVTLLLFVLHYRLSLKIDKKVIVTLVQSVSATSVGLVIAVFLMRVAQERWIGIGIAGHWVRIFSVTGVVLLIYMAIMRLFKSEELSYLMSGLRSMRWLPSKQ